MSKKYIFTNSDYSSGDGMMTTVWGPPLWHVLHTISFNYPINPTKEQKEHYFNFYNNLKNILPCKYCRDNLCNNLATLPLTMDTMKNRERLSQWVYDLHEIVNKMLNKESGLSYKDVRDRYEHFRSRCLEDPNNINKVKQHTNKESGCTEPLYGVKSKCVMDIVPKDDKKKSFNIDPKCEIKKLSNVKRHKVMKGKRTLR